MRISLSKRRRSGINKVFAVWSPTAAGKTMVAVNFAVLLSKTLPAALVDLSSDNAVYTWLNCPGTNSLYEISEGNPDFYYAPISAPKLQAYTAEPGSKNIYAGEAAVLSNITKALDDFYIVYDTPRDFLKAANVLTLADKTILVADYNIHGTLLLQKYIGQIKNKILVVNRCAEEYPEKANPEEVLNMEAAVRIPDRPQKVYQSVLLGRPLVADQEFSPLFEKLLQEGLSIAQ